MQRPSQGVIDVKRRGAAVLARSSGAGRRRLIGMGARSSATGDRVAPQPAAPPRRRWLLSAWTGSLNFVTALATKQALKVKPCETIDSSGHRSLSLHACRLLRYRCGRVDELPQRQAVRKPDPTARGGVG